MSLSDKLAEFDRNIWNHSEDEFQLSFDARDPLTGAEHASLVELIQAVGKGETTSRTRGDPSETNPREWRGSLFLVTPDVRVTRNKILTDLRAASKSGSTKMKMPTSHGAIVANDGAWAQAGQYLAKRLQPILGKLTQYDDPVNALEAVSRATWPGFIRQERAKRQGHEAEARLARVFRSVGIPFEPTEKADNPMCRDIIISDVSFDLVVPKMSAPRVCFKATVHTSNIGQYGESKDHLEIDEARRMLDANYGDRKNRPLLVALIDGIGFQSNRAGLEGVLSKADEFCQFETLWKAVVICAWAEQMRVRLALPPGVRREFEDFLNAWILDPSLISEFSGTDPGEDWTMAGSGFVRL